MTKRIVTVVLVLLSYVCPATGDMGRITTSEAIVHEDSQKAIILHNLDEEILILGTDFVYDRKMTILKFIPFPSEPKVSLSEGDPFERVFKLIKKYKLIHSRAKSGESSAVPVEMHFSARIGAHDVTVVKINEIGEFEGWVRKFLKDKGLPLGKDYQEVGEVASDYVKRGFRYFVFDLVDVTPEPHFVEPLAYRFKSKKLYYPLKISNTFGGRGKIDLIVFSSAVLCSSSGSSHSNCFNNPKIKATTSAKINPVELKNIFSESQTFFGNADIFMQLLSYDGIYKFEDDVFADIPSRLLPSIEEIDNLPLFPWENHEGGPIVKKPAIYLYPKKQTDVNVSLKIDGKLIKTIPTYSNGWKVTAYPNGRIAGGYDYLFYEVSLKTITIPKKGWIVEYKSLEKWFDIYLAKLGLNEKEMRGFEEYWLKELPYSKYYDIRLLSNTFLKKHMDFQIKPSPDTIIRLIFYFTPVSEKMSLVEPVVETPVRKGFTVVEWGGVLHDAKRQ